MRGMVRVGFGWACALALAWAGASSADAAATAEMRAQVTAMKTAPRGPFESLGWFCKDGSTQPARRGCSGHGGGIQHGRLGRNALALRASGFEVANVLAELDAGRFVGSTADLDAFRQILLERYLMEADEGWILRAARTYRGALQAEDEENGVHRTMDAILGDPEWRSDERFILLRESVKLLPGLAAPGGATADDVRQEATAIARRDARFEALRLKIHGLPDPGDAERVRAYASERGRRELAARYGNLATAIDELYARRSSAAAVAHLALQLPPGETATRFARDAENLRQAPTPSERLALASRLAARIRLNSAEYREPRAFLAALQANVVLEDEMYASGNELVAALPRSSRRTQLAWLKEVVGGLYGTGLLSTREAAEIQHSLKRIQATPRVDVYREEIALLSRAPEWAGRRLDREMGPAVAHLAQLEPRVRLYPQDRLRASPFLLYGQIVDGLARDANRLAGVQRVLFGRRVGAGLRALNPGIARGVLHARAAGRYQPEGIYVVPETVADMPPVAAILTAGEGSSLSHVQLLARNLGIPNVVVAGDLLPRLSEHDGERVVVAVSAGGAVLIVQDSPEWDRRLGAVQVGTTPADVLLEPDLDALELDETEIVGLDEIDSGDSGETVGPKSANLGDLRAAFPEAVPDGVVIPFGVFRAMLDRPIEAGGPTAFEWLGRRYRMIAAFRGDPALEQQHVRSTLAEFRAWIERQALDPTVEQNLRHALREHFGRSGSYGAFVRSDTNVEDLPGFTGAGLNLTVPNVVGEDAIIDAVRRVWASPFTERSYAWRQSHMKTPEWVFPAVLIQRAFPSEVSGVMVTADVEHGGRGRATIAVSEGVGGVVDGQAAESLLVDTTTGRATLLASASARTRRVLNPNGGITEMPATRSERLLSPDEVRQLVELAREAPDRFDDVLEGPDGAMPADIEFAFARGRLGLLQIRPFVDSSSARQSQVLLALDATQAERAQQPVNLDAVPPPS